MYNRLNSYIEDNELLYKAQYFYIKPLERHFPLSMQFLDIVSMIQTNLDKKMFTCIFLDFKSDLLQRSSIPMLDRKNRLSENLSGKRFLLTCFLLYFAPKRA